MESLSAGGRAALRASASRRTKPERDTRAGIANVHPDAPYTTDAHPRSGANPQVDRCAARKRARSSSGLIAVRVVGMAQRSLNGFRSMPPDTHRRREAGMVTYPAGWGAPSEERAIPFGWGAPLVLSFLAATVTPIPLPTQDATLTPSRSYC